MTIDDIIGDVLRREGGYVDNPNDAGGPTNRGITLKTFQQVHPAATARDQKSMSVAEAARIYGEFYYYGPHIDRLPDGIKGQVFDICVNSGAARAIRMLQLCLATLGYNFVGVDGAIGPLTVRACNLEDGRDRLKTLNNALADSRADFYRDLVKRDPTQAVFLKGWLARASEFKI